MNAPQTWEDRNHQAIQWAKESAVDRSYFVLRVDSQKIPKAIDILPQLGISAFAPVEQRTRRAGRGRRSSITRGQVIMSGYVIAGFRGRPNWYILNQLQFIFGVVSRDGKPAAIPAESMNRLYGIHQSPVTPLPGAKSLAVGDTIRVTQGGFAGFEAKLLDISGAECEFVVQLFGRDVKWRQQINQVEAA